MKISKPRHKSRSLIDHVCIKRALMEDLFTYVTVENIYFSDHDAVRILIKKYSVEYQSDISRQEKNSLFFRFRNFNVFSSVVNMAQERDRQ